MSLKTWENIVSWLDPISQNYTLMATLGGLFVLALFFSFREIWAWYSKTNELQKDLGRIKDDLDEILSRLEDLGLRVQQKSEPMNRPEFQPPPSTKPKSFPLGH